MKPTTTALVLIMLAGCQQRTQQTSNAANETAPTAMSEAAGNVQVAPEANASASVSLPDERTPLAEPKAPIDRKSPEGAGQVVQQYGALIEEGRWTESWNLWSDRGSARQFDHNWRNDSEVHMEIGKPGDMEGAAGSVYVSVPVVFYGKEKSGGNFRRAASVVLRRVNDVPGSTAAQRLWHIERIDWGTSKTR